MREMNATLILGFGEIAKTIIEDIVSEVEEYERKLLEYGLYQFLLISSQEKEGEEDYVQRLDFEDSNGFSQVKEKFEKTLLDKLSYLQSYQLPEEEENYVIRGGTAEVPRIINFFLINDLGEENSDLFVNDLFPLLLNLLKDQAVPNYNLCLILNIGVFDRNNREKVGGRISERFKTIENLFQKAKHRLPVRIYVVDRYAREQVLGSKEFMAELVSLFLQNLLLSDLHSSTIGKNIRFLVEGATESPCSTLGILALDCPIFQIIEYCTQKEFCRLTKEIAQEGDSTVEVNGRNWADRCDMRVSIPESRIDTPTFPERKFSVFVPNDELKDGIQGDVKPWLKKVEKWTKDKMSEVKAQTMEVKKESFRSLEQSQAELRGKILQIFREIPNGFYLTSQFLKNAWERLKERRGEMESPNWQPISTPQFQDLYPGMKKLFSAMTHRPSAKTVITWCFLFFITSSVMLSFVFLPAYGTLASILLSSGLSSAISFLVGLLIILIPHQSVKSAYNQLILYLNSHVDSIKQVLRGNLGNIAIEYETKALESLTAEADKYYQWINLTEGLFKKKQESFAEQASKIERLEKRVVKDSDFRKFVIKENDFPEIYRQQSQQVSVKTILEDFRKEFSFLNQSFSLAPYGFFEKTYQFIRGRFLQIKNTDYFSSNYPEYRNRLEEKMEQESSRILFYLVPNRERIDPGAVGHYFFFSGKETYRNLLTQRELSRQPDITIPLQRPNRIYLWKVMWGLPFEAIQIRV